MLLFTPDKKPIIKIAETRGYEPPTQNFPHTNATAYIMICLISTFRQSRCRIFLECFPLYDSDCFSFSSARSLLNRPNSGHFISSPLIIPLLLSILNCRSNCKPEKRQSLSNDRSPAKNISAKSAYLWLISPISGN